MRLDQIEWTSHTKNGAGASVEITRTVWDTKSRYYAVMRVVQDASGSYTYRAYYQGSDSVISAQSDILSEASIIKFLRDKVPFDPKGMSPLEVKCWLLENEPK